MIFEARTYKVISSGPLGMPGMELHHHVVGKQRGHTEKPY